MKLGIKIGDKAKVIKGKSTGKEGAIVFIDKRSKRVRLDGVKLQKLKAKDGKVKEVHGTFHLSSLEIQKPTAPAAEATPQA